MKPIYVFSSLALSIAAAAACSGADPVVIDRNHATPSPSASDNNTAADAGTTHPNDGGSTTTSGQKRVFVTSVTYSGSLGGSSGADQKCNLAAQGANLGGTWKAWLSSGSTNAIDRIADVGPWYGMDGKKVFNNKANLTTTPLASIERSEQNTIQLAEVWTGSEQGGTAAGMDCAAWTSADDADEGASGSPSAYQSAGWGGHSPAQPTPCGFPNALICFEQ